MSPVFTLKGPLLLNKLFQLDLELHQADARVLHSTQSLYLAENPAWYPLPRPEDLAVSESKD